MRDFTPETLYSPKTLMIGDAAFFPSLEHPSTSRMVVRLRALKTDYDRE